MRKFSNKETARIKAVLILVLVVTLWGIFLFGCAVKPVSYSGQTADIVSTMYGIAQGATEANPLVAPLTKGPLGFVGLLSIKYFMIFWLGKGSPEKCYPAIRTINTVGWLFAFLNIGTLTGVGTAAIPVVLAGTLFVDNISKEQLLKECMK